MLLIIFIWTNHTSSSGRKGRSSAKPWSEWNNGVKKIIGWDEDCQPIEPNSAKLATQLGYFARQGSLFPLTLPSWKKVEKRNLNLVWEQVQVIINKVFFS
jgi:hypothetical protein